MSIPCDTGWQRCGKNGILAWRVNVPAGLHPLLLAMPESRRAPHEGLESPGVVGGQKPLIRWTIIKTTHMLATSWFAGLSCQ